MKKMTMKNYEKSPMDKKADMGMKEGSRKDMKMDAKRVGMTNQATSKKKK